MKKDFELMIENSGLAKTKAQATLQMFTVFFNQAAEWEEKVKGLIITDETQTEEMKLARTARLNLRNIRVDAEKTKKKLKETILVEGRFIDAIYNVICGITQPLENELLQKENFIEEQRKARIAETAKKRTEELLQFEPGLIPGTIGEINEEEYKAFLETVKLAQIARKAEAERIAQEQERAAKEAQEKAAQDAQERERLKEEVKKLQEENEKIKNNTLHLDGEAIRNDTGAIPATAYTVTDTRHFVIGREKIPATPDAEIKYSAEYTERYFIEIYLTMLWEIQPPHTRTPEGKEIIDKIKDAIRAAEASAKWL